MPQVYGVITQANCVYEEIHGSLVTISDVEPFLPWVNQGLISFDAMLHQCQFAPIQFLYDKSVISEIGFYREDLPVLGNFAKTRVSSENLARLKFFEKFGSHEVSLQEIYDILAQELLIDPTVVSALIEEEIALEEFLVYPNPVMHSLLTFAKSEGKRVILCSDMYLPKAAIERLLVRSGYTPPFELYVSGTLRSSKHEGTLFHHVLSQIKIPKDRLVHFGDNQHADVIMPRKQGIKSLHWPHIEQQVSTGPVFI